MQQNPEANQPQMQPNPGAMSGAEGYRASTSTQDKHYDLVSVLYHALEGAQTSARYVEDANREGDQELAQFFIQVQQNQNACAERAKQLLRSRFSQSSLH